MTARAITGTATKELVVPVALEWLDVGLVVTWEPREIDVCIADIVEALNRKNLITKYSCCGHGVHPGDIRLWDGRQLRIYWADESFAHTCKPHELIYDGKCWKATECEQL